MGLCLTVNIQKKVTQHKNTSTSGGCSFPCTVHHQPKRQSTTTHWSRVLHHDGGPSRVWAHLLKSRRHRSGRPGCPAVGVSSWVAEHLDRGASASRLSRKKLRRTPTWRAICRISGSGKTLKVRTLGCTRSISLLPIHALVH